MDYLFTYNLIESENALIQSQSAANTTVLTLIEHT